MNRQPRRFDRVTCPTYVGLAHRFFFTGVVCQHRPGLPGGFLVDGPQAILNTLHDQRLNRLFDGFRNGHLSGFIGGVAGFYFQQAFEPHVPEHPRIDRLRQKGFGRIDRFKNLA